MRFIDLVQLLSEAALHTLLHSLWIAAACWISAVTILAVKGSASSHQRYLVAIVAFGVMVAGVICAFAFELFVSRSVNDQVSGDVLPRVLFGVYAVGACWMLTRLLLAVEGGRRLHQRSLPLTDPDVLAAIANEAVRLGMMMMPAVAICQKIVTPCVVGVFRPVLLLPMGFAATVSGREMRMIIAHELAHIQRYDHLINFGQRVFEALFYFNPAVWVLSRMVRHERECACDDQAHRTESERRVYAAGLLKFAAKRISPPLMSVAAVSTRSTLYVRIQRLLLDAPAPKFKFDSKRFNLIAFLLVLSFVSIPVHSLIVKGQAVSGPLAAEWIREHNIRALTKNLNPALANEVDAEGAPLLTVAAAAAQPNVVSLLLRAGATPEAKSGSLRQAAVHVVADMNLASLPPERVESVRKTFELLMTANASLRDLQGRTAAHVAARRGNAVLIKSLGRSSVLMERDGSGYTLLHLAAVAGSPETIQALLDQGAAADDRTPSSRSPMDCLAFSTVQRDRRKVLDCANRLLAAGASPSIGTAAATGQVAVVRELISTGKATALDKVLITRDDKTALHFAAKFGNIDICQILIDAGAGVDTKDKGGRTPLWLAAAQEWDSDEVVKFLLSRGANPRPQGLAGYSALHAAISSGNIVVVKTLLSVGSDIDARTDDGLTPLHLAVAYRPQLDAKVRQKILSNLLQYGPELEALTAKDHLTAAQLAKKSGDDALLDLLVKAGAASPKNRITSQVAAEGGSTLTTEKR